METQPTMSANEMPSGYVFSTSLGWWGYAHVDGAIIGVVIGHRTESAAWKALKQRVPGLKSRNNDGLLLQNRFKNYIAGEIDDFQDILVRRSRLTSFQSNVLTACRAIEHGETVTYGELARRAGSPKAARAVGSVMANNVMPVIIPCHRVVPSSGQFGGFSAPGGVTLKRQLLDLESRCHVPSEGHARSLFAEFV
ncbi:methylated-DNA--[protein]-cysteine S-methyltransferase [Thalassoroseus pseudoceratinae]|uniref:methylated-DNA--[protein]-cysteine S-methyltransferase n=1 Tax=Thalassoroseus pseudoceratinae TaxID=2713176 RepID=UPI001420EEBB|nr:methylated-DNA--[protein]-cysteine S-methyltransferase [Thalassoroseus pseudoceratinae]